MPLPLSVCRLETADEVKCGNATDKAVAGEIKVMWERIIFGLIVVFMSLPWLIVLGKITNKL